MSLPTTIGWSRNDHGVSGVFRFISAVLIRVSQQAVSSQCRVKNSFQVVLRLRSGSGSNPRCFRMLAMVPRATLCPGFDNAPCIRR